MLAASAERGCPLPGERSD